MTWNRTRNRFLADKAESLKRATMATHAIYRIIWMPPVRANSVVPGTVGVENAVYTTRKYLRKEIGYPTVDGLFPGRI